MSSLSCSLPLPPSVQNVPTSELSASPNLRCWLHSHRLIVFTQWVTVGDVLTGAPAHVFRVFVDSPTRSHPCHYPLTVTVATRNGSAPLAWGSFQLNQCCLISEFDGKAVTVVSSWTHGATAQPLTTPEPKAILLVAALLSLDASPIPEPITVVSVRQLCRLCNSRPRISFPLRRRQWLPVVADNILFVS